MESRRPTAVVGMPRMQLGWSLAGCWPMCRAREVELRIGKGHIESQRVAVAAGFVLAGSIMSHLEATGETYDDLRFVRGDVERCTWSFGPGSVIGGEASEARWYSAASRKRG